MGQEKTTRELQFQNDILDQMQSNGWLLGQSNKYNRELALYPEDIETFIKEFNQSNGKNYLSNTQVQRETLMRPKMLY